MNINIKEACVQDAQDIFDLIVALAEYEKEPDAVECSVEDFQRQLQQDNPPFTCFLASIEGVCVGFALYFLSYSTWRGRPCLYLEDLFVLPEYRRKGVGMALMSALASAAQRKGCPRLEWSVLNWNQLAIDFYVKIGAVPMSEWTRYRLEEEQIMQLAKGRVNYK